MRQHRLARLRTADLAEGEVDLGEVDCRRAGERLHAAAERLDGCMALDSVQLGGAEGEEGRVYSRLSLALVRVARGAGW
jgi:hypothetical protein